MKKNLLVLVTFFASYMLGNAQTFAPEGSEWRYCISGYYPCPGCPTAYEKTIARSGSFMFLGKEVFQLTGFNFWDFQEPIYIHVSGDSTSVFNWNDSSFVLLFNFSFQVGDTMRVDRRNEIFYDSEDGYILYKVDSVGTLYWNDDTLRFYDMSQEVNTYVFWSEYCWTLNKKLRVVEKIGLVGFAHMIFPLYDCGTVDAGVPFFIEYSNTESPDFFGGPGGCPYDYGSIPGENVQELHVYPNPANDMLYLSTIDQVASVQIKDVHGRIAKANTAVLTSEISIQNLASGIYFVTVTRQDGTSFTKKVIKN